jgi:hypothetical protein
MVDSTDINKVRTQTGQAFSILGQATGAEYKRRRKEEEDYQRRMMRDKFKYGLISAAISPAVQAFGQSASDFAGDLVFGEEENFFKDTEEGRQASYIARLNEKRLEELVAAKAEIVKEGQKGGSIQEVGVSKILEGRKNAIKNTEGGMEEGSDVFINEYIYSEAERKSALAEWEKQWGELNDGIKTLKAAPSLAEMEAAYKKTAIGKSRGRQAFGKALAWLKGKDYENDVRKPAIERILTAGVPGQTKEWYETSLADLEENYLKASNVVEGLDAYTDNLRKTNPKLGDSLKRSLESAKRNQGIKAALTNGDTKTLVSEYEFTEQEANFAIGMPSSNSKISPNPPQVRRAMVESLNADLSALVLNSTAAQHQSAGATFFSFGQNAERLAETKEQIWQYQVAEAGKGTPSKTYKEFSASATSPADKALAEGVEASYKNLQVQLSTEAERYLISDMSANPNRYSFDGVGKKIKGQAFVQERKYELMQLIFNNKLSTATPEAEAIEGGLFSTEFIPKELRTGLLDRRLSSDDLQELREELSQSNNPAGLTPEALASNAIASASVSTPVPTPVPQPSPVALTGTFQQAVTKFEEEYDADPKGTVAGMTGFMESNSIDFNRLPPSIQSKLPMLNPQTTVNVGDQVEYTSIFGNNRKRTTSQNTFTLKVDGSEVDVDFDFKGGRDAEGQRAQTLLFADIPESKAKTSLQEKADQYYANIQKMRNLNLSEKDIASRNVSLGIGKEARALKLANQRLLSEVDLPGIFDNEDVISLFAQAQPNKPELVEAVEDLFGSEKPSELKSAIAAIPAEPREVALSILELRNLNKISDKQMKQILGSAYSNDFTNQVLALLSEWG